MSWKDEIEKARELMRKAYSALGVVEETIERKLREATESKPENVEAPIREWARRFLGRGLQLVRLSRIVNRGEPEWVATVRKVGPDEPFETFQLSRELAEAWDLPLVGEKVPQEKLFAGFARLGRVIGAHHASDWAAGRNCSYRTGSDGCEDTPKIWVECYN